EGLITVIIYSFFIVGGTIAWAISTYNGMVKKRNTVRESESNIDIQLKRRLDITANLVETVKGYAGHEKETLESVVDARRRAVKNSTDENISLQQKKNNDKALSGEISKLFALSENYP